MSKNPYLITIQTSYYKTWDKNYNFMTSNIYTFDAFWSIEFS